MNSSNSGTAPGRAADDDTHSSPLAGLVSALVGRRVRDLRIEIRGSGLVLHGRASSYHAKQLAQHAVMSVTDLPLFANEIEVTAPQPDTAPKEDVVPTASVLLASGDDRLRHSGCAFLSEHGYAVATAADGVECAGLFRELVPDVVILDTNLLWGGADGVVAHIRDAYRARIPVVLLRARPSTGCEGLTLPVVSVVEKPVVMGALLRAVRLATAPGIAPEE